MFISRAKISFYRQYAINDAKNETLLLQMYI